MVTKRLNEKNWLFLHNARTFNIAFWLSVCIITNLNAIWVSSDICRLQRFPRSKKGWETLLQSLKHNLNWVCLLVKFQLCVGEGGEGCIFLNNRSSLVCLYYCWCLNLSLNHLLCNNVLLKRSEIRHGQSLVHQDAK